MQSTQVFADEVVQYHRRGKEFYRQAIITGSPEMKMANEFMYDLFTNNEVIIKWRNIAAFLGVSKSTAKSLHRDQDLPVWVHGNIAMTAKPLILKWLSDKCDRKPLKSLRDELPEYESLNSDPYDTTDRPLPPFLRIP